MDFAVICEVTPGLRASERTVAVTNLHGRREFLRIEDSFILHEGDRFYLPIGYIYEHPSTNSVLIELPLEADSGARRMFVAKDHVVSRTRVSA